MTPANDNTPQPTTPAERPAWFDARLLDELPTVRRHASSLAASGAEDLVSQTVLRALETWASYRDGGNFSGWVYWIMRKLAAQPGDSGASEGPEATSDCSQQFSAEIAESLGTLPASQRQAVLMSAAGHTLQEIGRASGVSHETARRRVAKARERLRAANDNSPKRKVG